MRLAACVVVVLLAAAVPSVAARELPAGFVYLRDIAPGIVQDMRYAGTENFTGQRLPGYEAAECVVQRLAADALAAVQADLDRHGLRLKVYDCYRPARAVRAMLAWARRPPAAKTEAPYHPRLPKRVLVADGYIAARSNHSAGLAVDATLAPRDTAPAPASPQSDRCGGPEDGSLDMGTGFDCFDPASAADSLAVPVDKRGRRQALIAAMQRHGFANYRREWWHFGYVGDGALQGEFDFAIRPRPQR